MPDKEIVDLNPKLSPDGSELIEIQEIMGGAGSSFYTPLSNIVGEQGPQGDPGQDGDNGAAATIAAGTTTTLTPGADATVVNSGTSSAATFDFGIPAGEQGIPGTPGTDGSDGAPGADGKTYYYGAALPDPAGYVDGDLFMVTG